MISVSNIERFATHDGPGIRTTIFLKGCPLHCPWCANPETWSIQPILMHDEKKCVHCRMCENICDKKAISFPFFIDRSICDGCGKCTEECLHSSLSISGKWMEIDEILQIVSKDDAYYKKSNGGITLSGGEPLFQFEKSFELIKALKEKGYHIAIETTGMTSLENIKKIEPYIDLFLHDVKHIDSNKLKEVTGADFDLIQKNLEYLSKTCPDKVIVRMPVIPGFNQDVIEQVIQLKETYHFQDIHLLPYHSLGKNKWHHLQKEYIYEDMKMMDKKELEKYNVKIGG